MMWLAIWLFWLSQSFKSDFDSIKSKVNLNSYYSLTSNLAIRQLDPQLASLPEIPWLAIDIAILAMTQPLKV